MKFDDFKQSQNKLKHYCNKYVKDLIFQNVLITRRADDVYAWLTLTPDTSNLELVTSTRLDDTLATVRAFAYLILGCSMEAVEQFCFDKVDCAMDFKGSFLPSFHQSTLKTMQSVLQKVINSYFGSGNDNFLCFHNINGLKVVRGDNIL